MVVEVAEKPDHGKKVLVVLRLLGPSQEMKAATTMEVAAVVLHHLGHNATTTMAIMVVVVAVAAAELLEQHPGNSNKLLHHLHLVVKITATVILAQTVMEHQVACLRLLLAYPTCISNMAALPHRLPGLHLLHHLSLEEGHPEATLHEWFFCLQGTGLRLQGRCGEVCRRLHSC